jgi:hypothetical protein
LTERLQWNLNTAAIGHGGIDAPLTNMFKVWQNTAPFGRKKNGSAVETLLTKVVNWQY